MPQNLSMMNFSLTNTKNLETNTPNVKLLGTKLNTNRLLSTNHFSLYGNLVIPKSGGCGSCGKK